MKKNRIVLSLLMLGMLLPVVGCQQPIDNSNSVIDTSIDPHKAIEERLVILSNDIVNQLPNEINEDLILPILEDEGYEVTYETSQSVIENGVLKFINGSNDVTVTLTITVNYGDLTYEAQKDIVFKGVPINNEGLENYLSSYKKLLPSLVKEDIVLPFLVHENYTCSVTISGKEVTHNIVKYTFPTNRKEATFEITVKDLETGDVLNDTQSFIYEKESIAYQIPKLFVDTNNVAITSKDNYVTGFVNIEETDENGKYQKTVDHASMKIKGRGNSTWSFPKKPYKIKFDKKTSLFGETAQKDWVLLANYADHTLIRDYLAKTLGRTLSGHAFVPCCHFVDLYLNGIYEGSYMITDQVEVKTGRVEVEQKSSETDTGYLLELDQRLWENEASNKDVTWFEINARDGSHSRNLPFDIKYPETDEEYFSHSQLIYIQNYMQNAINALSRGANWQDYFDIKSAVDFFLVEDLFKNVDVGMASAFMYKDKGGKLFFGPLWDFDLSSLNQGHLEYELRQHYGWYSSRWDKNTFCYFFMKDSNFKKALKERWEEWYPNLLSDVYSLINNIASIIKNSRVRNFQKWDIIGKNWDWYTSQEVYDAKTYDDQIILLKGWFKNRIDWMNSEIAKL